MKKLMVIVCLTAFAAQLVGCSTNSAEPCENTGSADNVVDTYTSASTTKAFLSGDSLETVKTELVGLSSDLASKAEVSAEGYEEPANAAIVQIMSVNPDGSVGFSTIHAWKYDAEKNQVTVELTDGQNAQNLNTVGKRGSLLVHGDAYYLLHLSTTDVTELEYSDEAYENGEFNSAYSGASAQLSEFSITFDVLSIEQVNLAMFN